MGWPLDPDAADQLTRSHGVDARLTASVNGSGFVVPLELASGSVKIDGRSAVRRTLDCEVVADLTDAAMDPFGVEVRAEYAIVHETTRRKWWVPVGTFVLIDAAEGDALGTVRITGQDRWVRINRARFEQPVTTSGDTVAAIVNLIQSADASIPVDIRRAPAGGTHQPALWDRDRSEAIVKLAASIGCQVYMDPMGTAVVRMRPTLGGPTTWRVGYDNARVSGRRGVSSEYTYNAVAVKSQPQGQAPLYAAARVQSGRLAYGGPFKRRARFYSTSLVNTQAGLQAMADGLLPTVQGVARTVDLTTLPNPALDADDVVPVEVAPGLWERHMVDGYTLPLGLGDGTVPLATRSDTEVDDGGE